MNKAKIGFAFLTLGALVLGACDSSTGGNGTPVAQGDLVGKWYYRKAVTTGTFHMSMNFGGVTKDTTYSLDTTETYTGTDYYMDLKADNTYTSNSPDVSPEPPIAKRSAASAAESGTWSVAGNTLTTISSGQDTAKVTIALSGNTLTGTLAIDSSFGESGLTMAIKENIVMTLSKQ